MTQKIFHFLSGLPRSGSTVLGAILNQNSHVYCTPTSPLVDQLVENQKMWSNLQTVLANPVPVQLDNISREIINAMWAHIEKPIVIDKNRGWGKNIHAANYLFNKEVKIIATVRDIPSIMASWLTIIRKNSGGTIDKELVRRGLTVSDENRLNLMWVEMVRDCVDCTNTALRTAPHQVMLIDYDSLVSSPTETLSNIEKFLDIPKFDYDFNNIVSETVDDDMTAWGLNGMHTIEKSLGKKSSHPKEILGDMLYEKYNFEWKNV